MKLKIKLVIILLSLLGYSSSWAFQVIQGSSGTGDIISTNNLSDIPDPATARTNLGLGASSSVSVGTLTATLSGGLQSGVQSSVKGSLILYSDVNPFTFGLIPSDLPTGAVAIKAPPAMPTGANFLWNVDADGTSDWTDPATLGTEVLQTVRPTGTGSLTSPPSEVAVGDALASKQEISTLKSTIEGYTTLDLSGIGILSLPTNVLLEGDIGTTVQAKLTIITGTKALLTTELAANTCRTETDTATGAASTDVISGNFNASVNGIAGYGALATDGMKIMAYPTTDTVNFEVCNGTATEITPGARTINWQIIK